MALFKMAEESSQNSSPIKIFQKIRFLEMITMARVIQDYRESAPGSLNVLRFMKISTVKSMFNSANIFM